MKLIFALGNNESQYDGTRHNVGFAVLDMFIEMNDGLFTEKSKFKALTCEMTLNGEKFLLAKPTTFYNLVGESFHAIADFYKIRPDDCLIIHDELALPFGTVRVRSGGSDAGNNGIKSINTHGGESTMRLRIGIANENRAVIGDTDFVLGRFPKDESKELTTTIMPTINDIIEQFSAGTLSATSIRYV